MSSSVASSSASDSLDLAQLTAAELKTAHWRTFLPEFYALATVVENNLAHDHQNVVDHTIAVMAGMEQVIQGQFLAAEARKMLNSYLQHQSEVAKSLKDCGSHVSHIPHTRLELLRLAILLHDSAKAETLLTDATGTTRCPAHEILAVAKVPHFQARFNLSDDEVTQVQNIIRHHGFPHDVLSVALAQPSLAAHLLDELVVAMGAVTLEVIILVYADILGSDFVQLKPAEATAREQLCQTWLDRLVRSVS